jgi:hypothetical protein
MSQSSFSTQPTCNRCNAYIDWNKAKRANLGIRGPLNPDGTIHDCQGQLQLPQQREREQQQTKTHYSAPNPNNYTGSSADYQAKPQDNITSLSEEIEFLRSEISEMKVLVNSMHMTFTNYMRDDPVMRSLSQFTADMLRNPERLLKPVTADELIEQNKRVSESMSTEDLNPKFNRDE